MAPGGMGVTPTSPLGDDGGDVTYPYFVINGRVPADPQVVDYRAGQRIRLRVINAGSDTAFRVAARHDDESDPDRRLPGGAGTGDSVILGMGERVDAIVTVDGSVPVVAGAGGQTGPRAAEPAREQRAEPGQRRRVRRVGRARGAARHRHAVTDAGGDAAGQGAGTGDRCPSDRTRRRLHLADQRQALPSAERRGGGEAESAGPDPLHQRVDDVPPVSSTRPHVPGDDCGRTYRRPARTPCWCRPCRPSRSNSTPTTPAGGSPTATTPITSRRGWRCSSNTPISARSRER